MGERDRPFEAQTLETELIGGHEEGNVICEDEPGAGIDETFQREHKQDLLEDNKENDDVPAK